MRTEKLVRQAAKPVFTNWGLFLYRIVPTLIVILTLTIILGLLENAHIIHR